VRFELTTFAFRLFGKKAAKKPPLNQKIGERRSIHFRPCLKDAAFRRGKLSYEPISESGYAGMILKTVFSIFSP